MRIGMVGLGRMGGNMAARLVEAGHEVVGYDLDGEVTASLAQEVGTEQAATLAEVVAKLDAPRVVWVMVPSGEPTGQTLRELAGHMGSGDILIDGGNSRFTDTLERAEELGRQGIEMVDAGTSGGIWGRAEGYCLMVGGSDDAVGHCEPIFTALAQEGGYAHVGPAGSGHYTKMVHNGIEYGLLQAYGEGFEMLKSGPFDLPLGEIAELWNHGSVVRGWLLELLVRAYAEEGQELENIRGWVADSGEGRWTVETAIDLAIPIPVIALSLMARFGSRQDESYSAQVIAALRNQFGGHAVKE